MTETNSKYQLVCGLEIHAELKTQSKMFCGCKNDPFGADQPNTYTCPVCLGMPGALPLPNKKAIEWTIKLGLALNCQINLFSKFDRKHYFYPDLPKGYQISQYDLPFCYGGFIDTSEGRVRITRIHLEEDTGKLLHKTVNGKKVSLIDFNRSGVPLVEIVTEPDIKTPTQAKEYAKKLRQIIRLLDIGNCDMEQGGMRLEANISLRTAKDKDNLPPYKVEVKNINSFRFLAQAIEFEIDRQAKILAQNELPAQETRGFNSVKGITFSQRAKESAADYRYFPDPDIPPIHFEAAQIEAWQKELPLLPEQITATWEKDYEIDPKFSHELLKQINLLPFYQKLFVAAAKQKIKVGNLASAIVNKKISIADKTVDQILTEWQKLTAVTAIDAEVLQQTIAQVLAANPNEVTQFKAGKTALLNFFIGQVMRQLKTKVDINLIKVNLEKQLH